MKEEMLRAMRQLIAEMKSELRREFRTELDGLRKELRDELRRIEANTGGSDVDFRARVAALEERMLNPRTRRH